MEDISRKDFAATRESLIHKDSPKICARLAKQINSQALELFPCGYTLPPKPPIPLENLSTLENPGPLTNLIMVPEREGEVG